MNFLNKKKNMMWKNFRYIVFIFLCGFYNASASDVYIETHTGEGQGILRTIGGECFVYTPAHVVKKSSDFLVSTRLEKRINSQLITTYPQDLALLKLPSQNTKTCLESSWIDEGNRVNTILEVIDKGELNFRQSNGRVISYDIDIIQKELHSTFKIKINHPTKTITKGMSGSIINVGNYPIGMLLSVNEGVGTVLRMDTMADLSSSVIRTYATDKELIELGVYEKRSSISVNKSQTDTSVKKMKPISSISSKQVIKGNAFKGSSESFKILALGNTAYRLTSLKQSDDVLVRLEFQNPAGKKLASSGRIRTDKPTQWEFGTVEDGEHHLVVSGSRGSGNFEIQLEVIATPEQLISESNVLGHGDTVHGMISSGTFAVYEILSRGNTAYRLTSLKQSDDVLVSLEFQNPAGKKLASSGRIRTDKPTQWEFGTVEDGEHHLVVSGSRGSGNFEMQLEVIATPEQLISESNVLGHGDTVQGMISSGTFAVYKILSRGNTAYRLTSLKQSDDVLVRLEFQNPAGKKLASSGRIRTDKPTQWEFSTVKDGEHHLVVSGSRGSGNYELLLEKIN
ncbi:hypothetical protein Q4601_19795 [Shewanella sp. 1_MG-2023]|uniref:hypothetical protein n=1 Tax=unclassified Shewanella TaxID=196818 RepID=UPI0026E436FF|nr:MULTISPECIES: hypothetical protein [unclassified Shewanella]MDO6613734.1 hypothetical protein [Shewanella sp. 7_MG-2023]MDO6772658.1 hypothetical protein [Shewanella sp. 2_MG-2023]MDO6796538.1 hypothetical protein [Shewanella sp. 1_MG-2023]